MAQDTDSLWKLVQEAEEKDRPKTAIESLEKIIVAARTANRFPEAVKALAKKITLEGHIEGYRAEEQIVRLREIVDEWPENARPILETVLAHWYWNYFQQNQWRFLERTRTGESPGDDIQTWDLPRILAEIDGHFVNALKAEEPLKRIPVADWDDLLAKGNVPDSYRPTLYDFVAFEALRFYRSGEQAGAGAEKQFRFPAESPVFDPLDDFLAWKIEAADENSLEAKGLRLCQQLLRFHKNDENPDARIDADLGRLEFGYEKAYGEEKNARYRAALKRFVEEWGDHPVSARARANWASVLREEGELVEARKIAAEGAKTFPDTPGGNRCANLVTQIEQPESEMSVERVWNDPLPEVSVKYRNLTEIRFRIYPFSWNDARTENSWWPGLCSRRKTDPEPAEESAGPRVARRSPGNGGFPAARRTDRGSGRSAGRVLFAGFEPPGGLPGNGPEPDQSRRVLGQRSGAGAAQFLEGHPGRGLCAESEIRGTGGGSGDSRLAAGEQPAGSDPGNQD